MGGGECTGKPISVFFPNLGSTGPTFIIEPEVFRSSRKGRHTEAPRSGAKMWRQPAVSGQRPKAMPVTAALLLHVHMVWAWGCQPGTWGFIIA